MLTFVSMKYLINKEDNKKTGVYCITNEVNNKIYVGSTSTSFYLRFHQHLHSYMSGRRDIPVLCKAFDKYGIDNFKFEILCICSKENCIKMEQFYIDRGVDYNVNLIAGSLLGYKHPETSKTRTVIKGEHHCAMPIDMYSKEGIFIKSFTSVKEAQEELNIKSASNITQCCKGRRFSAKGYRWAFKNEKLPNRVNRVGKNICQITKDDFEKTGTLKELVIYLKSIGHTKVRVSTLQNALNRNNKIYEYKIEKICVSSS